VVSFLFLCFFTQKIFHDIICKIIFISQVTNSTIRLIIDYWKINSKIVSKNYALRELMILVAPLISCYIYIYILVYEGVAYLLQIKPKILEIYIDFVPLIITIN
jgi:hypothetical protein